MQFHQLASLQLDATRIQVEGAVEVVHMLTAYMQDGGASEYDRAAFADFARTATEAQPYLQAVEWAPRVTGAERESFEKAVRAEGFSSFQFMDLDEQAPLTSSGAPRLVPEKPQTEYYPITFVEPLKNNEAALGLDILSEPSRHEVLEKAISSRRLAVSSRVHLVQEKHNEFGVLFIAPVFAPPSQAERMSRRDGVVLCVLRLRDLIKEPSSEDRDPQHMVALHVYDTSATDAAQLLYPANGARLADLLKDDALQQSLILNIGDRRWKIVATPGPGYSAVAAWSTPVAVLALGLIITGIGVQYLRMAARAQCRHAESADELLHMNRILHVRSQVNLALATAASEQELFQNTVDIISQEKGYPLAWIGAPLMDERRSISILASAGIDVAYIKQELPTWDDQPSGQGPTGTAIRERTTVMIEDLLSYPWYAPWVERAREHKLRSVLSVPLMVGNELVAALTVYARDDHFSGQQAFRDEEVRLILELAKDLSFGIEGIRRRQQVELEHTKRKQLEEQLQQSQRIEAVGRLAGGIAHDFNNLLMVIMAHTDLLLQDLSGPSQERANNIMRSATRAAELTSQLLAFSRKQLVQPELLTFNEVLDGMADMMPTILRADIAVNIERCPQPWTVKADRNQIERVLMNLIVNSRDAMPNGGQLTIRTDNILLDESSPRPWYMTAGRYASIAVSDTGTGMDEATQQHLFEPFFTTKEPGKGTGLGLSMVYGIVKKANGYILVNSAPGRGTSFCVYLPYCDEEAAGGTTATPADSSRKVKATVLLVEDDDKLRAVITDFLKMDGHEVLVASGVDDACAIASQQATRINLLLTDVVLQGGNGPQLVKQLAASGMHFRTIYMSGYTGDAIEHHGIFDSSKPYLQKPFTRERLLTLVQDILHARA